MPTVTDQPRWFVDQTPHEVYVAKCKVCSKCCTTATRGHAEYLAQHHVVAHHGGNIGPLFKAGARHANESGCEFQIIDSDGGDLIGEVQFFVSDDLPSKPVQAWALFFESGGGPYRLGTSALDAVEQLQVAAQMWYGSEDVQIAHVGTAYCEECEAVTVHGQSTGACCYMECGW